MAHLEKHYLPLNSKGHTCQHLRPVQDSWPGLGNGSWLSKPLPLRSLVTEWCCAQEMICTWPPSSAAGLSEREQCDLPRSHSLHGYDVLAGIGAVPHTAPAQALCLRLLIREKNRGEGERAPGTKHMQTNQVKKKYSLHTLYVVG